MALKYRRVYTRFYEDEKVQRLDPLDKLLALYLLTSSQTNRIGLYVFSIGRAAEDLGIDYETLRERFGNVCQTFRWGYDAATRMLYISSWWRYNPPENLNVFKGNLADLNDLPRGALIDEFMSNTKDLDTQYVKYIERFASEFGDCAKRCRNVTPNVTPNVSQTIPQTLANTVTGTVTEYTPPNPPQGGTVCVSEGETLLRKSGRAKRENDPAQTIWVYELWKMLAHPDLPRLREGWTVDHHEAAEALIARHGGEEVFRDRLEIAITNVNSSPFLLGQTERRFRCSVNWLLGMTGNKTAFANVLAGVYGEEEPPEPEAPAEPAAPRPELPSRWAGMIEEQRKRKERPHEA
jgi:hypothetical protein